MTSRQDPAEEMISDADMQRDVGLLLRRVRAGRRYVVTTEGSPVARLVPCEGGDEATLRAPAKQALFERLDSQPAINLGITWIRDELYER